MKASAFLFLVVLVTFGWLGWRYSSILFRRQVATHFKRNWWVPFAVLIVLGGLLYSLASAGRAA